MADVLTNNGEEWIAERVAGTQGTGANAVSTNTGTHIGMGTIGTAPAKSDTALGGEVETRGATTVTVAGGTGSAAKYQAVATLTATTTRAIQECGLFSASTTGTMFTHSTFTTINLNNGDSIQFTLTIDPS